MRHKYKGSGVYEFSIIVYEEVVHTADNNLPLQFHNVKMYTSDGDMAPCTSVTISYLEVTNFL